MYGFGITADNVNEALPLGLDLVKAHGKTVASRGLETLEVPGPVMTVYRNPWENVLFCPERDANPFFHFFESLWIMAGADSVHLPKFFLNRITDYSDDGERFHGAYGQRLRDYHLTDGTVVDQLEIVAGMLRENPDTRQAVASIWDPRRDLGRKTKDMPCNDMITFKVRDGALNMTVFNRSNDVIWGAYGANAVQFSFIQQYVAARAGCGVGMYTQISDSYHVYVDNPLWQKFIAGEYRPAGHVTNPYKDSAGAAGTMLFTSPDDAMCATLDAQRLNQFAEKGVMQSVAMLPRDAWGSSLMRSTGRPMAAAYMNYKAGSLYAAIDAAHHIEKPDWRMACLAWLQRRVK